MNVLSNVWNSKYSVRDEIPYVEHGCKNSPIKPQFIKSLKCALGNTIACGLLYNLIFYYKLRLLEILRDGISFLLKN